MMQIHHLGRYRPAFDQKAVKKEITEQNCGSYRLPSSNPVRGCAVAGVLIFFFLPLFVSWRSAGGERGLFGPAQVVNCVSHMQTRGHKERVSIPRYM